MLGRAAAGIWAALRAWGIRDQTVWLPANTCYIVLWAVLKSGNYPVLLDVDAVSGNTTPAQLPNSALPAVIIPCHLYGTPAPMAALVEWAQAHQVRLIEDAALTLGESVNGQPVGSWGDVSILSLGQGKIVDNGLGGAFVTDDRSLAKDVSRLIDDVALWDDELRQWTQQWNGLYWTLHQHDAQHPGLAALYPQLYGLYSDLVAYRLPFAYWHDVPALLHQLPQQRQQRLRLSQRYYDALKRLSLSWIEAVASPAAYWRYPLHVAPRWRDELLEYLWEQGIHDATRWYPSLQPMAAALCPMITQAATPQADHWGHSIINLRLDAGVDDDYAERVVGLIQQLGNEKAAL